MLWAGIVVSGMLPSSDMAQACDGNQQNNTPRDSDSIQSQVDVALATLDYRQRPDPEVLAGLIHLVESGEAESHVRRRAALTLGRLGSLAPEGVAPLRRLLAKSRAGAEPAETALWVLPALGLYGAAAHGTAGDLAAIARDATLSRELRISAVAALVQMGPTRTGLATIGALISDHRLEFELRAASMEGVVAWRQGAAMLLPQVLRWFDDPDPGLRGLAASALGGFGALGAPAEECLADLFLGDESPLVRETAAQALMEILAIPSPWMLEVYDETVRDINQLPPGAEEVPGFRMRQTEILRLVGRSRAMALLPSDDPLRIAWQKRLEKALNGELSSEDLSVMLTAMEVLLQWKSPAPDDLWRASIGRGLFSPSAEERRAMVRLFQKHPFDNRHQAWLESLLLSHQRGPGTDRSTKAPLLTAQRQAVQAALRTFPPTRQAAP